MTSAAEQTASQSDIVASHLNRFPVNLDRMAEDLGLKVSVERLPANIAGKLMRDGGSRSGYRAYVNLSDAPRRQRFTLAHEIGHFILHRDLIREGVVDDALYRSSLSDEYERQADRFAAQILLPAATLRAAFKTCKALAVLANKFDVSDAALRIRLKELGLNA